MKNTITPEIKAFIEKVQHTMNELYEEYNTLPKGLEFECPLTRFIDDGMNLYCMKIEDTINEKL